MEAKFVSEHRVELLIPRPTNTFYDRTGNLSTYGIWKMIDDAFIEAQKRGFLRLDFQDSGYRVYSVRDRAIFSPKIYRTVSSLKNRFLFKVTTGPLGTSSVSILQELIDPCTEEVLVSAESKTVAVDQDSRRPRKLPQWFIEKWPVQLNAKSLSTLIKQEAFIPPENAFQSVLLTRYSDLDNNDHVNFAEYYRFCADCASEASLSSYYRYYSDDLCWYPVLETNVTFLGESLPCVKLHIFTWQDRKNKQRIFFAIYEKETMIFQASYVYSLQKSCDSKL